MNAMNALVFSDTTIPFSNFTVHIEKERKKCDLPIKKLHRLRDK